MQVTYSPHLATWEKEQEQPFANGMLMLSYLHLRHLSPVGRS
jgi:hypothetical protein